MLVATVVEVSQRLSATRSRTAKAQLVADTLREAAAQGGAPMVTLVSSYLAGVLPQRRVGVGWRGLAERPEPAQAASLTVPALDQALSALAVLAGQGSVARRQEAVAGLLGAATAPEQSWIVSLITGEVRQGASDGVMLQAIALGTGVGEAQVRRAVMLAGFAAPVAAEAFSASDSTEAAERLAAVQLEVGRPLRPMLAGSAPQVADVLSGGTPVALETKVDGIRIQAHLSPREHGDAGQVLSRRVRLFTRTLEEVTDRMPEVVEQLAALPVDSAVLDGEVIVERDGRPAAFQVTGSRTMSRTDPEAGRRTDPLTTYLFDVMHLDGRDLVELPARSRWQALHDIAADLVVPREVTDDAKRATAFFEERVAGGHEGVVIKTLDAPYAAGRRGAGWVKVKPRHTLDLVVLAVEQGSGRRRGWLSNIHLGAREESTGEFVMVGKTFKGMTDEMLEWQTERFRALQTGEDDFTVQVRPEQVVEIAFDGVQRSRRYPGGVALRFARVLRYRQDKSAEQADTLAGLQALLPP